MKQGLDISDISAKLESTVLMVWPAFCNEELEAIKAPLPGGSEKIVTKAACTYILGGFSGSVSVEMDTVLLNEVVKDMMRIEEATNDDLNSVAKELTNVISGNLKINLSTEHSILSSPKSFDEVGFGFELPDNRIITTILFKAKKGFMVVKLHDALELDMPKRRA